MSGSSKAFPDGCGKLCQTEMYKRRWKGSQEGERDSLENAWLKDLFVSFDWHGFSGQDSKCHMGHQAFVSPSSFL
jgi:hypothetical protein